MGGWVALLRIAEILRFHEHAKLNQFTSQVHRCDTVQTGRAYGAHNRKSKAQATVVREDKELKPLGRQAVGILRFSHVDGRLTELWVDDQAR